ncbi:MAG: hypothetical protein K2N78_09025, partial [Oscillospiraceae bacterium]|nr:hypothetical protein [Oscillospiraceae bacterium]
YELCFPALPRIQCFKVLDQFSDVRVDLGLGKGLLSFQRECTQRIIFVMDINPNIGYTAYGDPSLYVVIPAVLGF